MTRPRLTLIAAVSADGYISRGQGVPWDLPRDRAQFRRITDGQWLLIARRTYEEMTGWFRNHQPLVLTQQTDYAPTHGQIVRHVDEALDVAARGSAEEVFVCGGGSAYALAMPHADRLLITHVETHLGNGVPFPAIATPPWTCISEQHHAADAENEHAMTFREYQRR